MYRCFHRNFCISQWKKHWLLVKNLGSWRNWQAKLFITWWYWIISQKCSRENILVSLISLWIACYHYGLHISPTSSSPGPGFRTTHGTCNHGHHTRSRHPRDTDNTSVSTDWIIIACTHWGEYRWKDNSCCNCWEWWNINTILDMQVGKIVTFGNS